VVSERVWDLLHGPLSSKARKLLQATQLESVLHTHASHGARLTAVNIALAYLHHNSQISFTCAMFAQFDKSRAGYAAKTIPGE
jgi:hypothetical protein